jgi:hypothetical protein
MNRFLMLAGVAAVAAAMYVTAASGSQQSVGPTAKQFAALKREVTALKNDEGKVKKLAIAEGVVLVACDQSVAAVNQYGNPGGVPAEGYVYQQTDNSMVLKRALAFTTGSDPNALYFAFGDRTCFNVVSGLRHRAAQAGIRVPHAFHPSFSARRP